MRHPERRRRRPAQQTSPQHSESGGTRWTSNSKTVEIAIALDIHREVRVVVRPFLVLRELDLSHGLGETLVLVGRLFYCCRQILQVGQRGARVLLGSDLAAVRAGMTRD